MAIHDREELDREDRLIRANTRASLMSDTKWRKLLVALDESRLELRRCIVKFVGDAEEKVLSRPIGLYPPRPWVDTFQFGPIPLRSIEWLLFPRIAEVSDPDRTIPRGILCRTSTARLELSKVSDATRPSYLSGVS